jgi:hypothetical protein
MHVRELVTQAPAALRALMAQRRAALDEAVKGAEAGGAAFAPTPPRAQQQAPCQCPAPGRTFVAAGRPHVLVVLLFRLLWRWRWRCFWRCVPGAVLLRDAAKAPIARRASAAPEPRAAAGVVTLARPLHGPAHAAQRAVERACLRVLVLGRRRAGGLRPAGARRVLAAR